MCSSRKNIYGLGPPVTQEDACINGSRLPTGKQILRSTLFHIQEGSSTNRTKYEAAKLVYSQVIPFYQKGGIPLLAEQTCCQKIVQLVEENIKLRRIPKSRREHKSAIAEVKKHQLELEKTFPLWTTDAEDTIKNPSDLQFLKSM